jgi:uncharacterized membrane protein
MNRAHIHVPTNISEAVADAVTRFLGSWWCVYIHALWFVCWFTFRGDVNLLTLIVSLESIFLSTFVMMSQARAGTRDKQRDDVEAEEVALLLDINRQQLEILRRLPNE